MSVPQLSIVRADTGLEAPAARAQRLYAEARAAAFEQVDRLEAELARAVALASQIADGGDVYPPGVRDLCRRLGEEIGSKAQTLELIAERARRG
jgi:hypothetical protein